MIPVSDYNMIDIVYCICLPTRKEYMMNFFNNYYSLIPSLFWIEPIMKDMIDIQELKDSNIIMNDCNLNTGRIACHLSHLKCLDLFLNSNNQTCLIFEDDIAIDSTNEYVLEQLSNIMNNAPSDYNVINLGRCWDNCMFQEKINDIFVKSKRPLCRHSYITNRKGASKILQHTLPMGDIPGDRSIALLQDHLVIYSLYTNLFNQNRSLDKNNILYSNLGNNVIQHTCSDYYAVKIILLILIIGIIGIIGIIVYKQINK